MDYFPHDTHAMGDDRLLALRIDAGLEAVACYWVVLEKIYENEAPFEIAETNVEAKSVSYKLGVGFDEFRSYVGAMVSTGLLFYVDNGCDAVMSARAQEQIDALNKKRETARRNGKSGGRKPSGKPTRKKSGTDVGTDVGTESASYKTLNGIGSHKREPIPNDTNGAAAADAAPPVSCPICDAPMERTNSTKPNGSARLWRCALCGEEVWR